MARRSALEGTQLKDGRWQIRVTVTTIDGRKKRVALYGKTKAEAQRKAQALIYEESRKVGTGATVSEVLQSWLHSVDVKPKTFASYKLAAERITDRFGSIDVELLTTPQIVTWLAKLDVGSRTVKLTRTVFGIFLNWCVLNGFIRSNPLLGIRLKSKGKVQRLRLDDTQWNQLIAWIPDQYQTFFRFCENTGLRPWKEALHVTRENIGYSLDTWFVEVVDSKSDAGVRIVPIDDRQVLDAILEVQSGPLFDFTYDQLKSALNRKAKLKPLPFEWEPYALRRRRIAKWCESLPLDVVQRYAGHSDLRLTLDIYNEVSRTRMILRGISNGIKLSEFTNSDAI